MHIMNVIHLMVKNEHFVKKGRFPLQNIRKETASCKGLNLVSLFKTCLGCCFSSSSKACEKRVEGMFEKKMFMHMYSTIPE